MMDQDKIAKTSDKVRTLRIYEKNARLYLPEMFENIFFCYRSQRVFGDTAHLIKFIAKRICIRPATMGATRGRCTAPWQAIIRVLAAISRGI